MSHHAPANALRATGGVLLATKKSTAAAHEHQQQHHNHHQQHHAPLPQHHTPQSNRPAPPPQRIRITNDTVAGAHRDAGGQPANKRRKLSHGKAIQTHTQTTLDRFALPKPPSKITIDEPHGQLVETINGVRTELNLDEDDLLRPSPKPERIQRATRSPVPAPAPTKDAQKKEDKRTLRSQDDGPRLKSELAIYFPNYEDIMFDVPREEEFLNADTTLYIKDDPPASIKVKEKPSKANTNGRRTSHNPTLATPQRANSEFNGSSVLDLDFAYKTLPDHPEDPLTDAHFFKSHRRAERKEKQLRNIERERAMHEKVQLERILDGLQGHDWLKVLGITGVTDGEAKRYDAKRAYFVAEVKALVDKFRQWKEQEKKQRLEKDALAAARAAEEEGETSEGSVEPPSSDLNASAARQLLHETANAVRAAAAASSTSIKVSNKGKGRADANASHPSTPSGRPRLTLHPPAPPLVPDRPFTSFYRALHLREAALGKARHGRNITAFGHSIPDMEEEEFQLPEDLLNPEVLKVHARERRRRKRESAVNAAEKDGK